MIQEKYYFIQQHKYDETLCSIYFIHKHLWICEVKPFHKSNIEQVNSMPWVFVFLKITCQQNAHFILLHTKQYVKISINNYVRFKKRHIIYKTQKYQKYDFKHVFPFPLFTKENILINDLGLDETPCVSKNDLGLTATNSTQLHMPKTRCIAKKTWAIIKLTLHLNLTL